MSRHEIDIPELPEGWKPVVYRKPYSGEHIFNNGYIKVATIGMIGCWLIVEKIQPLRRIVLEETESACGYEKTQEFKIGNNSIAIWYTKVLREVKETNLPLTNEFHKLSLSADEARSLLDLIIESNPPEIVDKLCNFVEANS